MRILKNKAVMAIVIIAVISAILSVIAGTGTNPVTNTLNTLASPIQNLFAAALRPVHNHVELLDEMKGYKAENDRLVKEITRLKIENRDVKSYAAENDRLKKLLDLQEKNVDMTTVAVKTIAKNFEKWDKGITVNKGKSDGIKKGNPVITPEGVLGIVKEVGENWAKVTTIFDPESAIGAEFTRTGDVGVVEGEAELSETGKCRIEYISATASVINGDILVTSGLGEVYPRGLMIGKVSDVKVDAVGNIEYAIVDPAVDFNNVYEALVVTDFKKSDTGDQQANKDNGDGE